MNMTSDAWETVLDFINALNVEDFTTARACLNENMRFSGVLGSREVPIPILQT